MKSTSNPFDAHKKVENDDELGENRGISNTVDNVANHPYVATSSLGMNREKVGLVKGKNKENDLVKTWVDAKVMDHSQEVHDSSNGGSVSSFSHKVHNGGSILDILDDMVRVGHSMGYNLDGCLKDMERIIGSQGDEDIFK
ncbi:hypothetical protein Tco_1135432 [Tanacetum coccineum]